jgi:hydroxymethylpyrimidine/phosphomethylpyrimidine kinase
MAVIAAMTAQNTRGVSAIAEVAPDFVAEQLDAILTDIVPDATKTGMLLNERVIKAVVEKVIQYRIPNLIVDPVMISSSGTELMTPAAVGVLRRDLLPLASLITPNLDETGTLTGATLGTTAEIEEAARHIHGMGARHVLIKGGHAQAEEVTDILFDGHEFTYLKAPRVASAHTHGTGCVLSASIAAYCALGKPMKEAIVLGKEFVTDAIRNGLNLGAGVGPCDPLALRN